MYKWYVLGTLAIIALLFVVLGLFKNGVFKKNNKTKLPIHKTLIDLKNLEKKKIRRKWQFQDVLCRINRHYQSIFTQQYHIPADVLLTDDLIDLMKIPIKFLLKTKK
jgi:hypothetical protein